MFKTEILIVAFICVGLCFAVPTNHGSTSDSKNAENDEVDAKKVENAENEVDAKVGNSGATDSVIKLQKVEIKTNSVDAVASPLSNSPSILTSENEPTFGAVSGHGEGHFVNEEFGFAGKGAAAGVAGGVVNDKGVTAGGAAHAAGFAGVDTEPFKGFVSVSTNQQATFNNYGEKPAPFKQEVKEEEVTEDEAVPAPAVVSVPVPAPTPAKAVEEKLDEKAPTVPLPTMANTIGSLFRPVSPLTAPVLFNTLTGGIFTGINPTDTDDTDLKVNAPRDEESETSAAAAAPAAAAPEEEEESGFYSFIRPLTPTGIAQTVTTMLKPLTTLAGQAQGSISLTGGASYTGNPPEPKPKPIPVVAPPKPVHDGHHDLSASPCTSSKPCHHGYHEEEANRECKALCHKKGKSGGSIHHGCCTCTCPAPEVPPGKLCCSGEDDACNAHCKRNGFHHYSGGSCNAKTNNCECRCSPWEPCWIFEGPSHSETHHHHED